MNDNQLTEGKVTLDLVPLQHLLLSVEVLSRHLPDYNATHSYFDTSDSFAVIWRDESQPIVQVVFKAGHPVIKISVFDHPYLWQRERIHTIRGFLTSDEVKDCIVYEEGEYDTQKGKAS